MLYCLFKNILKITDAFRVVIQNRYLTKSETIGLLEYSVNVLPMLTYWPTDSQVDGVMEYQ